MDLKLYLIITKSIFLLLITNSVLAKEINGWKDVIWGMTEKEVRKIYEPGYIFKENNTRFKVEFQFDNQNKLEVVRISPTNYGAKTITKFNGIKIFNYWNKKISNRYGPADNTEVDGFYKFYREIGEKVKKAQWYQPKTIIDVVGHGDSFSLEYRKNPSFKKIKNRNFRESSWGMNIEEVKKSEKSNPILETTESLQYEDELLGSKVAVVYTFHENKLYQAGYVFKEKHTNKNYYLSDYDKLKEQLIVKYSEPDEDEVVWHNDLYRSDVSDWGMATSVGHLSYLTQWDKVDDETKIYFMLSGDNYKISTVLRYGSLHFNYLKSKKNKQTLNKL